MTIAELQQTEVRTCVGDLPDAAAKKAKLAGLIGWDIETSGFDWANDRIATCQIFIPGFEVYVVRLNGVQSAPENLKALLEDEDLSKIFHHAMFDLRFMGFRWSADVRNIACTKIASKILNPSEEDHTLKSVLQRHLGIHIEKELGNSDWLRRNLTSEQVHYAVQDAVHLPALLDKLQRSLQAVGRWHLAKESFAYLPTRATLDILGAGDVFRYEMNV